MSPDLRLFFRGDEVEVHRRLVRSGVKFGTCLRAGYLHPDGSAEFRPILGGRMHTQYPDNDTKRYFTYRNRGYLMSQPGMRKLLPPGVRPLRLVLPCTTTRSEGVRRVGAAAPTGPPGAVHAALSLASKIVAAVGSAYRNQLPQLRIQRLARGVMPSAATPPTTPIAASTHHAETKAAWTSS